MTSVFSAVNAGITGGAPIPSSTGTPTGYTTNQAKAALVTPDFVTVYSALLNLPTVAQVNQALHSISAEPYASMQSVALEAIEQLGKNSLALTDRSVPLTHTASFCKLDDGTLIPADSPNRPDTCDERTKTVGSRWSLLLDGTNTEASLDGTNDLASLDYNVFSTIYGLQYAFSPEWSAGAAFGYGQARLYNYEYANTHINSDTYSGSIWGIYRPSPDWKFSGLLGYMNLQYDSNRTMAFGGLNRTAEANWDGNGYLASLEAQYNWALNGNNNDPDAIRLKPRTFLSYANHQQGSFSESGAKSLNLAVDSHTADSLLWGIGFTLETPIKLNSTNRLIPRLTVGYEYDFMGDANEEHELTASFSEMPALGSVDVLGQNRGANALDVGLSIEIETSDSVSLYAGVNGGFWSNGTEVSYGGGLKYSW
ncbi:autotransporter outer membrane beta-barrel domain-containing protein [Synechococcus sp. HK01-R]|uniref:autotransporter outer membrane beta-barrel domain-containing protein n=1 Tax=Synechococcus sp. HK01-R TaxID=2751171 RepID=UPI00162605E5|nr:autotransporter outer membrane beta-barrel domain-containing protein [Synechococcus sp. HK01-R]QNG26961.1 autotransporter outer membrane beta-barrel domain-containing protein [Synechococcus sp. HK01-R]